MTASTEPTYLTETRAAYDVVAADYAELLRDALPEMPFDRVMLASFAELVRASGVCQVADVGCGPGRLTRHLDVLGLDVLGVDLSPGMVAVARTDHPDLRFEVGDLRDLSIESASLGGVVAWYSLIHTPPEALSQVLSELHRVLRPGGVLLTAFQVGDERVRLDQAYGHTVSYDVWRMSPDRVAAQLARVGLEVQAQLIREPDGREKTAQAYLIARKRVQPEPVTRSPLGDSLRP